MPFWSNIAGVLATPLDQAGALLATMPFGVAAFALALPLVLTLVVKRLFAFLGVAALLAVALAALLAPAAAPILTAIAAYLAALLVAVASLEAWRARRVEKAELTALRAEIQALRDNEERGLLKNLNAPKNGRDVSPKSQAALDRRVETELPH